MSRFSLTGFYHYEIFAPVRYTMTNEQIIRSVNNWPNDGLTYRVYRNARRMWPWIEPQDWQVAFGSRTEEFELRLYLETYGEASS